MRFFSLKRAAPTSPAANAHALAEQRCHENVPCEQCLAEQLHGLLLDLDFPAFALCLCRLLRALGYQDVHLAGRREWKGYNKPGGGGYDLEATLPGSLLPGSSSPRRMIVQIKQFDGLHVHQRSVDELRGTCLRVGAAEALLITTSAFSKVVRAGVTAPGSAGSSLAPVRLMDGEELIALLIQHRLGIREYRTSTAKKVTGKKLAEKHWEIDEPFFAELALASAIQNKKLPGKCQSFTLPQESTPAQDTELTQNSVRWRVTVRISSNPKGNDGQKEGHQKGGG